MTTRYRMTTDVQAWRVGGDGSLPDEARQIIESYGGKHVQGQMDDDAVEMYERIHRELPMFSVPPRAYNYWWWLGNGIEEAHVGDWITHDEDGDVKAMTDAEFRARCVEVPE